MNRHHHILQVLVGRLYVEVVQIEQVLSFYTYRGASLRQFIIKLAKLLKIKLYLLLDASVNLDILVHHRY